jgi:hypothetical protein
MMRFGQQDPSQYVNGMNLYEALTSNPINYTDWEGLQATATAPAKPSIPGTQPTGISPGHITLAMGDTGTVNVYKDSKYQGMNYGVQFQFKFDGKHAQNCDDIHWLQFFKMTSLTDPTGKPTPFNSSYLAGSGRQSYLWLRTVKPNVMYVDVHDWIQTAGFGQHVGPASLFRKNTSAYADVPLTSYRSPDEISLFDSPTAGSFAEVNQTMTISFDTFLLINNKVYWHIQWENVGSKAPGKIPGEMLSTDTFDIIKSEAANALTAIGGMANDKEWSSGMGMDPSHPVTNVLIPYMHPNPTLN